MSEPSAETELLREVATALRWAAHGGAERVPRQAPEPARPSVRGRAPSSPAEPGRLRLRDREPVVTTVGGADASGLAAIRQRVGDCQRCPLHKDRTQIVFGSGPAPARLMIIGSGPHAAEDAAGQLWQGEPGALLDRMLAAMGLFRAEVYLASLVMCRLPEGQPPPDAAIKACTPFLRSQLSAVAPDVVLVLGEPAAHFLMRSKTALAELRGSWWPLLDWPAITSHGLGTIVENPALKRESWADLQQVMTRLGLRRP